MKRTMSFACLIVALAVPAHADQLARSLGVAPGVYTTAELAMMRKARQDNEDLRERLIASAPQTRGIDDGAFRDRMFQTRPGGGAPAPLGPGSLQLAGSLGIDPGDHSAQELSAMFLDAYD